jgi:mRNA-degrading endonuclease RelE of RelBE toxin-antitoxin system
MNCKIIISPNAIVDYKGIPIEERSIFRKFIDQRLSIDPERTDDLTIKGLPDFYGVKFEFTTGEASIYYDIVGSTVEILVILISGISTEAGLTITQKGTTISRIPKVGIRKFSISELMDKIENSRYSMKSGNGLAFDKLPL